MIAHLPNILSLTRFILGLLLILSLKQDHYHFAILLILTAGITDFLDGFIARLLSCTSAVGHWLDPAADKFFFLCLFVTLFLKQLIKIEVLFVFLLRDAIIFCGWIYLKQRYQAIAFRPSMVSKLNTALQFVYPLFILHNRLHAVSALSTLSEEIFMHIVVLTTIASGIGYIADFFSAFHLQKVNKK